MKDANTIIEESVSQREEVYSHVRAAADFFHEHEGTFFERGEAIEQLSDELSVEADLAGNVIAELVGDIVDPVVLSAVNGKKYVGVVEFEEFDGAYGYVDYHDVRGPDKRVVCQQCVNEAKFDTQVAHATAGDPSGTVSSGADYDELLEVVYEHYENSHDVVPEDVATGATLASGTTIGGNESWHAGNDGSGSGLDADTVDGIEASSLGVQLAGERNTVDVTEETGFDGQGSETLTVSLNNTYEPNAFIATADHFGSRSGSNEEEPVESAAVESLQTDGSGNITGFVIKFAANKVDPDNFISWGAFGVTV